MQVPNNRQTNRHMKGKQVALTLYLPPRKYWLLKALSEQSGESMQTMLRAALDIVLAEAHRHDITDASARGAAVNNMG